MMGREPVGPHLALFDLLHERIMTQTNHRPPLSGPTSDPIVYGVAQGLTQLFPLINPIPVKDEQGASQTEIDTPDNPTKE